MNTQGLGLVLFFCWFAAGGTWSDFTFSPGYSVSAGSRRQRGVVKENLLEEPELVGTHQQNQGGRA